MTFRCAGPAVRPLGNGAESKAIAPGLPRQTSKPTVNHTRARDPGLPPDCIAPCGCVCLHLHTASPAPPTAVHILLDPEVSAPFPYSLLGTYCKPCWWELWLSLTLRLLAENPFVLILLPMGILTGSILCVVYPSLWLPHWFSLVFLNSFFHHPFWPRHSSS